MTAPPPLPKSSAPQCPTRRRASRTHIPSTPHPKHAAALACIHAARAHRAALQPPPYQNLPYHGAAALAYWADATGSRTLPELNSLLRQLAALD